MKRNSTNPSNPLHYATLETDRLIRQERMEARERGWAIGCFIAFAVVLLLFAGLMFTLMLVSNHGR